MDDQKCFIPNEALANYINNWNELEKERSAMKDGKKLSNDFERKVNVNNRMKNYVLNTVIFPSMANLLHFFWQVSKDYKFRDLFDDEIKAQSRNQY